MPKPQTFEMKLVLIVEGQEIPIPSHTEKEAQTSVLRGIFTDVIERDLTEFTIRIIVPCDKANCSCAGQGHPLEQKVELPWATPTSKEEYLFGATQGIVDQMQIPFAMMMMMQSAVLSKSEAKMQKKTRLM